MSSFTLDGGQAAGTGLGNLFKAFVMGPQAREQAQAAAAQESAKTYAATMQGDKFGAEAALDRKKLELQSDALGQVMTRLGVPLNQRGAVQQKLDTGSFGAQYDALPDGMAGPVLPGPVSGDKMAKLGEYLALAQQMYGTGSNVDQAASAQLKQQQGGYIDRVAADPSQAGAVGRAYAATDGKPLFDAVGTTGQSMDRFTGQAGVANEVLAKLFGEKTGSEVRENNASAGNSRASSDLTQRKIGHYDKNGSLPGTTGIGSRGDPSIDRAIDDARAEFGVRYPLGLTGERPKGAPDFDAFMGQWLDKRGIARSAYFGGETAPAPANKNPSAPPAGEKMSLPPGVTSSAALAQAKQAIANGKDRAAVIKRLQDMGVDAKGL